MFSRRSEDYRSATDLGLTQGTNRVSTATAIANFDRNIKALFARVRFVFRTKPEIEIRELDIIREIYKGCFRPATAEQIPMFLRKDDARKPWFIVTEEQIIDALRPLSRTATTSDIASHMEFFINIIIDSLTERTECFADKYTYAVGSMLTFLAELAAWAKNLKIDDLGNTQQEVQQRIQYLDAIMVQIVKNDLFKEPKTSYRMEILVDKLRKYLGETVLVRVQREISSQSSRDHFKNVRVYLTNFLVIASRWLCVLYCSKDFLETAKSLDISKLSRDGIESRFLNQFLQTDLGSLFQILGHIRALQLGDVPSAPGEVVASYSFYDGSDELRKDLVAKTEAVVAEVKQADHKGRVISGFHSCLYSEIDVLLPLLLKSLAMIETLSNYLLIFNNYFHITGIGGDIAAYLVLAEDLDVVLSKCTGLLSKIEKNILQVKDIFEKIFSKILRMPDVIYDDWKINYMEARVQFFELKNALELSGKTINIIASEMQRFLSHKKAVQEEFEQRVDETRRLLTVVSRQEYYLEHPQTSPAALGQRADNVISMAQQLLLSSSSPAAAPVSPFGGFFRGRTFSSSPDEAPSPSAAAAARPSESSRPTVFDDLS